MKKSKHIVQVSHTPLTHSLTHLLTHSLIHIGEFALNNQHKILSDCEAIVTRYNSKSGSNSVVTDMYDTHSLTCLLTHSLTCTLRYDVLILFCLRKEIEYMPLYCDLLVPFFLGNEGNSLLLSRPLASTCFYSFVNKVCHSLTHSLTRLLTYLLTHPCSVFRLSTSLSTRWSYQSPKFIFGCVYC